MNNTTDRALFNAKLAGRYRRQRVFVACGVASALVAGLFLLVLLTSVVAQGWRAFLSASLLLEVPVLAERAGANGDADALAYQTILRAALRAEVPQAKSRADKKELYKLIPFSAAVRLREYVLQSPQTRAGATVAVWLPLASAAERYLKGGISAKTPEARRALSNQQLRWLDGWRDGGKTRLGLSRAFFTSGDSRDAENAGIAGALVGSFYSLALAFLFSFPVGVLAAVYLQMFAPRNRWFDIVEININNLAAVPSVIFGLLGLAIFINFFQIPRGSPLVGGLVLSLMTLPTIVIATRAALAGVSPSLLQAALGLGATKMQGVFQFVLPAAMPGILTGAIIGMAGALGETAPLLMIGMVVFVTDAPGSVVDVATALPAQIFLWADNPERGFAERASAAIVVLLFFLLAMNALAIYLRRKLEIKW